MRRASFLALAGWLALSLSAGVVGALLTDPGEWYDALAKPAWTPPKWLFGPVWTALYLMMGVAAWLVWERRRERDVRPALALFVAQLALNAAWSWLFFGLHRTGIAFAELATLWLVLLATIGAFWRVRPLAGILLLPYLAWVSYAAALNFVIWRANPAFA